MAKPALTPWFHKKIVDPLIQILQRGSDPHSLALSAALGTTLGLFPICGVPVFLCGFAIAVLGSLCHAPTIMLSNFISTPVELSYFWRIAFSINSRCTEEGFDRPSVIRSALEHLPCVAGMARGFALYFCRVVCTIFTMFQDLAS